MYSHFVPQSFVPSFVDVWPLEVFVFAACMASAENMHFDWELFDWELLKARKALLDAQQVWCDSVRASIAWMRAAQAETPVEPVGKTPSSIVQTEWFQIKDVRLV